MNQVSQLGWFTLAIELAVLVVLYRSYHSGILPSGRAGAYLRENGACAFGCMLSLYLIVDVVLIVTSVRDIMHG